MKVENDTRPINCRFRLYDEGKPYPRSSCQGCGKTITTGLGGSCWHTIKDLPPPQHFNGLSPRDQELLVLLAEEAGEVIQAVGKILRHGLDSYHPNRQTSARTNRTDLAHECGDLMGVIDRLFHLDIIDGKLVTLAMNTKMARSQRYLHHQEE